MPAPSIAKVRTIIRRGYGPATRGWIAYTGATAEGATPVLDFDGARSFVDIATVGNSRELTFDENFQFTAETYRITVASDAVPDANETWWISTDNGVTKTRVNHITRKPCHAGAYARVVVQR